MMDTALPTHSHRLSFTNASGQRLSALYEAPTSGARANVLFAHCFTCTKQIGTATRISRALAARGFGVLRFDFTGLGSSEGDFANTNFSSNVEDLVCAADHLRAHYSAPAILIGHSLGGTAVLAAAAHIPEASALVTIAAPSDPAHVAGLLAEQLEAIHTQGYAQVEIAGQRFTIKRQFLDDLQQHPLEQSLKQLQRALLVFHSPVDEVVDIEHARAIYAAARHPKSFISLDRADHMLSDPRDAQYVAETLAAWARRYIELPEPVPARDEAPAVLAINEGDTLQCTLHSGRHRLLADEPLDKGGEDLGLTPRKLLHLALAACTAITLRMYARLKKFPLKDIRVQVQEAKGKDAALARLIHLEGELDEEQRQRMLKIANRCPVHKMLTEGLAVDTRLAPSGEAATSAEED